MLLATIILKGLVEVLLLCHVAQAILFVFAGATRDRNIVYKLFLAVNKPVWLVARKITPKFVIDAHVGFVSFFLLSVAWAALVVAKIYFFMQASAPPA